MNFYVENEKNQGYGLEIMLYNDYSLNLRDETDLNIMKVGMVGVGESLLWSPARGGSIDITYKSKSQRLKISRDLDELIKELDRLSNATYEEMVEWFNGLDENESKLVDSYLNEIDDGKN